MAEQLFKLGKTVCTNRIAETIGIRGAIDYINRHVAGDFGDLCDEDKDMNNSAIKNNNDRILSAYTLPNDEKIYVITEWDRSVTTVLYADEY